MTPATWKPWWDELSVVRKVAVFASPPISVVLGLAALVVMRPSGLELAGFLLLVVAGAALCASNVRDLLRKRNPPRDGSQPAFDVTVRGYRRSDVDRYLASLREQAEDPERRPDFGMVFRGYDPHQVDEYLTSVESDPPGPG